ncbi:HNH endonuclease [Bradyrhizobium sp. KBS0727]|uniref:HNH endonuclease n=1 Tax=Bradyrhizobium sp. KBS0727 TaxID=2578114 RepID=UPI00110D5879|nr:HNH endonuclease [Bradyrhizobium sp. KBS0727]
MSTSPPNVATMEIKLGRLKDALLRGRRHDGCLRLWSDFIRERDGHRCVDCHSRKRLSAHHICRKSFLRIAEFQTGNGITLCHDCHKEMHRGFNARPDLSLPVDAQGGEKLAAAERLFSILTDDAVERNLMKDEFYFLSDKVLGSLKRMQGYDPATYFPGSRIEQAYLILAECELGMRRAMAGADGMPMTSEPLLPGGLYLVLPERPGEPRKTVVVRTYVPRSKSNEVDEKKASSGTRRGPQPKGEPE